MGDTPDGLLEIAVLRRAHGVRGQVNVELASDRPERIEPGARWWSAGRWLTVVTAQPHHDRWLLTFEELADRESAQHFTNQMALAEPLDGADELWVHELIGSEVVEVDGTVRGRCVAVIDNPAADLLELESGALVPVVFIVEQGDRRIVIDPPDGLFELNDSDSSRDRHDD